MNYKKLIRLVILDKIEKYKWKIIISSMFISFIISISYELAIGLPFKYWKYNISWHFVTPLFILFAVFMFFYHYEKIKVLGNVYLENIQDEFKEKVARQFRKIMYTVFPTLFILISWFIYLVFLAIIRSREFLNFNGYPTTYTLYVTVNYHPLFFWLWHIYHNFILISIIIWILWTNLGLALLVLTSKRYLKTESLDSSINFSKKLMNLATNLILEFYAFVILVIGNLVGRGDIIGLAVIIGGVIIGLVIYFLELVELKSLISYTKSLYLEKIKPSLRKALSLTNIESILTGKSESTHLNTLVSSWALYNFILNLEEWPVSIGQFRNLIKGLLVPLTIYLIKLYAKLYLGIDAI